MSGNLIPGGKECWILKAKKSMIARVLGISKHTLDAYMQGKRGKQKLVVRGEEGLKAICEEYYRRKVAGKIQ